MKCECHKLKYREHGKFCEYCFNQMTIGLAIAIVVVVALLVVKK